MPAVSLPVGAMRLLKDEVQTHDSVQLDASPLRGRWQSLYFVRETTNLMRERKLQ